MINYLISGIIAVILLIAHLYGLDGYYFIYDWYDIPMHIVGGISLGFLAYQLSRSISSKRFSWKRILLGIICIGLAWEVFESVYGIAGAEVGTFDYYVDSIKDLINDSVGAIIGIVIASFFYKNTHKKDNVITN
jgi:VanZ family protein